mgnify:CR=1 FL=1
MKKLLILGANPETIPLIQTANALGYYTIVTDNVPNAIAKKYAAEGIDIDGTNVDMLVSYCVAKQVDGVLVGVADRLIQPYNKVCHRLNVPCYATEMQADVLTDKDKFNTLCNEYNIRTIPSMKIYKKEIPNIWSSASMRRLASEQITVIKPVDSNSGKGMRICASANTLLPSILNAFKFTKREFVLVERFMQCRDVIITYTIINGNPILSLIGDRYTCSEQGTLSRVCQGAIYPSTLHDLYKDTVHDKMVNMMKGIGLKNAILTVSAFFEDGIFYHYDPGFRLQGEAPDVHIEKITGFDQKKFLIDIAMANTIDSYHITDESLLSGTIWFLAKAGVIGNTSGFYDLQQHPYVIKVSQRLFDGDTVSNNMIGTEGQVVARVYFQCPKENAGYVIKQIQQSVAVTDVNGNNQLLNGFIYE